MPTTQMTPEEVQQLGQDIKDRIQEGQYEMAIAFQRPTLLQRIKASLAACFMAISQPFTLILFFFGAGAGLVMHHNHPLGGVALLFFSTVLLVHFSLLNFQQKKVDHLTSTFSHAATLIYSIYNNAANSNNVPARHRPHHQETVKLGRFKKAIQELVLFLRNEQSLVECAIAVRDTWKEIQRICHQKGIEVRSYGLLADTELDGDRDEQARSFLDFLVELLSDPYRSPEIKAASLMDAVEFLEALDLLPLDLLVNGHKEALESVEMDELDGMGDCGCGDCEGCEGCGEGAAHTEPSVKIVERNLAPSERNTLSSPS